MKIWFLACTVVMYFSIIFRIFHLRFYTTHSFTYIQAGQRNYIQRFWKDSCKKHVGPFHLLFLELSFVIEKFFYFRDHHPTRSTHVSNGHENMQSTCIGTPHVLSSGSLHRWHHDTPERVHACHSDSFRLSHNGPFERITTVTTNTPWRLNVWCGETCWGNDSVWRIHFVRVLQSVPQTGHRKTHGTCCTVLL